MRTLLWVFCCLALLGLGGVSKAEAGELTVSAAASLTNAFTELKQVFEKERPGVRVHMNFAASNPLLKQIEEGAPVDVFATADQQTMDRAAKAGHIVEASRKNFARNSLVLIVPKGAGQGLAVPADLGKAAFMRIGVGKPAAVPAGRYTQEALSHAQLWESLKGKFVFGESVRQVLNYVARGEVDAGFVYATDALKAKDKVDVVLTMQGHSPVEYPIACLQQAKNTEDAAAFIGLVLSAEGQRILAKYGFSSPE